MICFEVVAMWHERRAAVLAEWDRPEAVAAVEVEAVEAEAAAAAAVVEVAELVAIHRHLRNKVAPPHFQVASRSLCRRIWRKVAGLAFRDFQAVHLGLHYRGHRS